MRCKLLYKKFLFGNHNKKNKSVYFSFQNNDFNLVSRNFQSFKVDLVFMIQYFFFHLRKWFFKAFNVLYILLSL